ncbi:ABC transporter ATP-binding protein [Halococcus hamelinensis]|uniref:ABC transporter ATP-binding protein n=1 Tax=Halococcus hamelinensis 100A6 TaxID=1132509 RepID=M0LZA9_9EURY|nr:ABC transporter ATP-binding protein [Halococcus hamelinensis]EMA38781.1 ABC transporter ATP-binding protein [Halococcus hamelinensis 100A6]
MSEPSTQDESNPVITVEGLTKHYGDVLAVDDVSFAVREGEIFGVVGPNGSGKTTTVESVMGLGPFEGEVRVLGLDPRRERTALAQRIGMQLQAAELPARLTVLELLDLFSTFYDETVAYEPLLEMWGIDDERHSRFEALSGGQQQRLFIALALLNDPEVVFVDELTTGLDPEAREAAWRLVERIREEGTTVVLVTHYMAEAETLCDRVAILDDGDLVALDTPRDLLADLDAGRGVVFDDHPDLDLDGVRGLEAVERVERADGVVRAFGAADDLVSSVVLELEGQATPLRNLRTLQPDLADVFMERTGRTEEAHGR